MVEATYLDDTRNQATGYLGSGGQKLCLGKECYHHLHNQAKRYTALKNDGYISPLVAVSCVLNYPSCSRGMEREYGYLY